MRLADGRLVPTGLMCQGLQREALIAVLAVTIMGACAKEMPPPGILPDDDPPRIEKIFPTPDSIFPNFDGEVLIRFNEPVNIPSGIERQMFVSPMERYLSEKGFSELKLRPAGGWRNDVVYCFSIPEGISDLSRNRTENPIEFCFSTGVPLVNTRIAGTVTDAVTGLPQDEARVIFFALGDTTPYGAITDAEGHFAARALPPGRYQAFGFLDQNRNLVLDRDVDPHDSVGFIADRDSFPSVEFSLVAPDTTPPRLLRAQSMDTITLRLEFDDYLINPPDQVPEVSVRDHATREIVEVVAVLVGDAHEVFFPDDSVEGDSVAPPNESDETSTNLLPSRYVSVRLAAVLDSGRYLVETMGVVNLRHLLGGGDTTFVVEDVGTVTDSIGEMEDLDVLQMDTTRLIRDTLLTVVNVPPIIRGRLTDVPHDVWLHPQVPLVARRSRTQR